MMTYFLLSDQLSPLTRVCSSVSKFTHPIPQKLSAVGITNYCEQ